MKRLFFIHSVAQSATIVVVITMFFVLTQVILNYMHKSRIFFEGAHSLVRLDAHFRNNLAVSSHDNSASFLMILVDQARLFNYRNSTIELLRLQNVQAVQMLRTVYNDTDIFRFIVNRKIASSQRWQVEFKNYAESIEKCGSESDVLNILLSVEPSIYKYNNSVDPVWKSSPIGLTTFLRNFEYRNTVMMSIMQPMRTLMLGKEPPFEFFGLSFTQSFLTALFYSTEAMQASYNGIFTMIRQTILQLKEVIVVSMATSFNIIFLSLTLAMFFLLFCGAFLMLALVRAHSLRFTIVLESYRYLRSEDIYRCSTLYNSALKQLTRYPYNEMELSNRYVNSRLMPRNSPGTFYEEPLNPDTQRNRNASWRKQIIIKQDLRFSSSIFAYLTNGALIACITIFFLVTLAIKISGSKIHEIERLYFNSCSLLSRVSESLATHYTYINYGNFIKIDGKYIEDFQPEATAIKRFNTFWLNNRDKLSDFFPPTVSKNISDLLYGDLCNYLSDPDPYQQNVYRYMCTSYLPTAQGMVSYLNSADQQISEDRMIIKATNPNFLAATRINLNENYDKSIYLKATSQRIRDLFPKIIETFLDKLFEATDSALSARFNYIFASLWTINLSLIAVVVCVFSVLIVATYRLMQANSDVCRETFANMLPEVVFSNPHLSHTFDHHVSASK